MNNNLMKSERKTPVVGRIALAWVCLAWVLFLIVVMSQMFTIEVTDRLAQVIGLAGVIGGAGAALVSLGRGEQRGFAIGTFVLLALSPVLFIMVILSLLSQATG